jgi:hypothetical protein
MDDYKDFEIFERKVMRRGTPTITVTKLGRIAINKTATQVLEKQHVEFVLLMWSTTKHKIAIRPITKKDARAYNVTYGEKGNGAGFSAKTFCDYIGLDYTSSRSLPAAWNDDYTVLEAEVPAEFLKGAAQNAVSNKVTKMEANKKGYA